MSLPVPKKQEDAVGPRTRKCAVDLEVSDLPPLPEIATQVLALTSSDEEVEARKLSALIEPDQGLTAKILRIANSAFFYRTHEIKTVKKAAVLLGNDRVRSLAVEAALMRVMNRGIWGRRLWEHALGVGVASREIARAVGYEDPEGAFVAALLHDVGKALFAEQHPSLFEQALNRVRQNSGVSTVEAEMLTLGLAHTQAGALVAIYWHLPAEISEVILYHHDPDASTLCPQLCAIVNLADLICLTLGVGVLKIEENSEADIHLSLGITKESLEQVWEKVEQSLNEQRDYLGLR